MRRLLSQRRQSSLIRYAVIKRNLSGNCIIWKTAFSYLTKYKSSRCRYCYHAYRQSISYVITAEAYLSFYLPLCRIFSHYSMNMCKRGWISGIWSRISSYFRNFIIAATNILNCSGSDLIQCAKGKKSLLIITNGKRSALKMYFEYLKQKNTQVYYLSTYQTANDRQKAMEEIREKLKIPGKSKSL